MFMFCTLIKESILCTSNSITIGNDVEGSGIKVDPVQIMRAYWGMEVMSQSFLTSAVGGGEWSTSPW